MADRDDKTEDATPKKLAKLREEGSVVKSADIAAAVGSVCRCALWWWGLARTRR